MSEWLPLKQSQKELSCLMLFNNNNSINKMIYLTSRFMLLKRNIEQIQLRKCIKTHTYSRTFDYTLKREPSMI